MSRDYLHMTRIEACVILSVVVVVVFVASRLHIDRWVQQGISLMYLCINLGISCIQRSIYQFNQPRHDIVYLCSKLPLITNGGPPEKKLYCVSCLTDSVCVISVCQPLSICLHLFRGAGHEKRRGEQLKWSLAFRLYIGSFPCAQLPGPVHTARLGRVFFFVYLAYSLCLVCSFMLFDLFVCPYSFMFP